MSRAEDTTLEIKRIIPARREEVFRAWTEPELMLQWWRQVDTKYAESVKLDVREGGKFEIQMRTKTDLHLIKGRYLEIREPEKLVFTWRTPFTYNKDTKVTVLLKDLGTETELLLIHEAFPDKESRDGNLRGWSAIIDNIASLEF